MQINRSITRSPDHPIARFLLLAAVLLLYTVRLGDNPIYLHSAEVLFGLHAHAIATTGHDLYGRFLPLYFQMRPIGDNVWFHPILVYVTALFLTVVPLSEWAIRFPSAAVGVIDVALVYGIARRLAGSRAAAFLAAALLALTPAHFIHSRVAMDYLYPVPFVLGWFLALLRFLDGGRLRWLLLATSLLGLGVYSYIAALILLPVYVATTLLVLAMDARRPLRQYAVALAGFCWPITLMAVWLVFHPTVIGDTFSRYLPGAAAASAPLVAPLTGLSLPDMLFALRQSVRLSSLSGRISLYWYFFDPAYLFITGGYANVINSTRHVGVFLIPLAVAVPAGLWRLAREPKTAASVILLIGLATAPLAACIAATEAYAIDRELELLPFVVLIATGGIVGMLSGPSTASRRVGLVLLIAVPLHFAGFLFEYFGEYRRQSAPWFEGNRRGAIEAILAYDRANPAPSIYLNAARIPYVEPYWTFYLRKHERTDLLPRSIYYDARTLDIAAVPRGSLLLTVRDDEHISEMVQRGALQSTAAIPEPDGPPLFKILQR